MQFENLNTKTLMQLRDIAKDMGIKSITTYKKNDLISVIIASSEKKNSKDLDSNLNFNKNTDANSNKNLNSNSNSNTNTNNFDYNSSNDINSKQNNDTEETEGVLQVMHDGYGFVRTKKLSTGHVDVFISPIQIRRFKLKTGDQIKGVVRINQDSENYPPIIYVLEINGHTPENAYKRRDFEDLKPIYPNKKLNIEDNITNRIISLTAPIGKGQRGLIVSSPKTGKTSIIKSLANSIEKNHPEVKIFILLIDERPEEVTDIERSVNKYTANRSKILKTEVIASTFDEQVENHAKQSEITLERSKRLVEEGKDVVILLDSITRMARAYNILTPSSGKILSGGLDPLALHKPKKFFGSARNIEEGGSLTIIATCLVDTGSRMDDVIYEEFKGTGNMELHLDRSLSELRIFPAVDILKSGTRRDDLLLTEEERLAFVKLRKSNKDIRPDQALSKLIKMFKDSENNFDLIENIKNMQS